MIKMLFKSIKSIDIWIYIQTATYQFNPYFFHDLSLSLLLRCDPVKWTREREKGRIKIGFEFNTVTTLLNFTKYWKYKNLGEIQLLIWKHTNMFANNVGCEFHSAFTIWQCLLHIASTEAEAYKITFVPSWNKSNWNLRKIGLTSK